MHIFSLAFLLGGISWARPALPDYRGSLGERLAADVARLNQAGRYRDAVKLSGRVTRAVGRLAPVAYENGYAHYQLGEFDSALRHYSIALQHDPKFAAAAYDRGEILLLKGDEDGAAADFLRVVKLKPNHWGGHFRLAHLAGLAQDSETFEKHLMDALRYGFDLELVMVDPDWNRFVADEIMRPVLRKVVVLYGNERLTAWVGDR